MIAIALITLHYYLVKMKGISLPFWMKRAERLSRSARTSVNG